MAVLDLIRLNIEQRHIDKAIEEKVKDPSISVICNCIVAQAATEFFGKPVTVGYTDIKVGGSENYKPVDKENEQIMLKYTYSNPYNMLISYWKNLSPGSFVIQRIQ